MRHLNLLAAIAIAAFALAGCSDSPSDNPPGDQNAIVAVNDGNFNPTTRNIMVDSVVEWQNEGAGKHTVTADDGSFDSGDIPAGESWDRKFEDAGTFAYHCKYHAKMTGTITVSA